jgi:hypothetical protein
MPGFFICALSKYKWTNVIQCVNFPSHIDSRKSLCFAPLAGRQLRVRQAIIGEACDWIIGVPVAACSGGQRFSLVSA